MACSPALAPAAHPLMAEAGPFNATDRWEVVNGTVAATAGGPETVLRWSPNEGQTAELRLRPDQPLFDSLRYYDRLRLRFRVTSGAIDTFGLKALGHVSGPRQHKPHHWNIAIGSTPTNAWHERDIDLTRPNWFPWDNPDGEGRQGYFTLSTLASAPGTAIELAAVRLARSALLVKPFYELPVTWPLRTMNADGSATYRLTVQVLNTSGEPATITARVLSRHDRFAVTCDTNAVAAKANQVVSFPVSARISREDIARGSELDSELLRLAFVASSCPGSEALFETRLVRPLTPGLRRQVILPESDLLALRKGIADDDAELKKKLDYARTLKIADGFLARELRQLPPGHQWPGSKPGDGWVVGAVMPAITNLETGAEEFGTSRAGLAWKQYLAYPGYATEHLGLAYLFTGDDKYAAKALELFRLYARQYTELPWGRANELSWLAGQPVETSSRMASSSTYGANIFMKHHMRLLSMVAGSAVWTPGDWSNVHTNFAIPYAAELAKAYGEVNNQSDITSHNLTLLGLVFDDALMVHQAVMADAGLMARIRDLDADGFSSEGRPINYHYAGMEEYLPAVEYLANAGLRLPFESGRLLEALRMPYRRATLSGWVPLAGDCARGHRVGLQPLAGHLVPLFPEARWLQDISGKGTLASRLRAHAAGLQPAPEAWRDLLETTPTLFPHAGFAILRTGTNASNQIMATLDYGRAYLHVGANRNQLTLAAFGALLSHDPGSLYNIGSGGMTRTPDPRLDSFALNHTVGFNVIAVDARDQSRAMGKLIGWSSQPAFQVAVSRIESLYPGVSHTRGLVLTEGLVIVLDRVEADREHTFDFIYHNLGRLVPQPGWTAQPLDRPLATTANYENIQDLQRLSGTGPLRLTWDLTEQYPSNAPLQAAGVALDRWQLPVPGGEIYTGLTGLNNPNLKRFPDTAPSLFHRVRGRTVDYMTVLEPRKGKPRVTAIAAAPGGGGETIDPARIRKYIEDANRRPSPRILPAHGWGLAGKYHDAPHQWGMLVTLPYFLYQEDTTALAEACRGDTAFPITTRETYTEDFNHEFFVVRRPAYHATLYAGRITVSDKGATNLGGWLAGAGGNFNGFGGGGLSTFWTPSAGTLLIGRHCAAEGYDRADQPRFIPGWQDWANHHIVGQTADGKILTSARTHQPAFERLTAGATESVTINGLMPSQLPQQGRICEANVGYSRRFDFLATHLEVTTELRTDKPLAFKALYETLPVHLAADTTLALLDAGGTPVSTNGAGRVQGIREVLVLRKGGGVRITFAAPVAVALVSQRFDTHRPPVAVRALQVEFPPRLEPEVPVMLRYALVPCAIKDDQAVPATPLSLFATPKPPPAQAASEEPPP